MKYNNIIVEFDILLDGQNFARARKTEILVVDVSLDEPALKVLRE